MNQLRPGTIGSTFHVYFLTISRPTFLDNDDVY